MGIPDRPISVPPADFLGLLELTHDLSNSVGMTMNLLIAIPTDVPEPLFERLSRALELATRASCTLRTLMWQLGEIRHSSLLPARGEGAASDDPKNA